MKWNQKVNAVVEIPQRLNQAMIAIAIVGIVSLIALLTALAAFSHAQ
jgi:hypothetical protein